MRILTRGADTEQRGAPEDTHVSKRHDRGRTTKAITALVMASVLACSPALLAQPPANGQPAAAQAKPAQPPGPESAPAEPTADPLRAEAAARKKAGDEAMDSFRFADALAAYSDAYTITKDTALLYNMGRALQALNRYPEALDKLEAFQQTASPELRERVPRLPKLIAELRQRVSTLTIRTNVEGARIVVRSSVIGKAPLEKPVRLAAGPAEIEIDAEGYFPGKKIVELPGGAELTVDLNLFSKSTTGVLAVKASAPGAEVLVDGKRIGVAPLEMNVAKGTHKVVVKHPDYRVYETSAVVEAGGTKRVEAALQSASIATRWWFWTTVGVVVAAGTAVTIAALTPRPPDSGTIAPGQIEIPSSSPSAPALISW